jgi:hypothetical protein
LPHRLIPATTFMIGLSINGVINLSAFCLAIIFSDISNKTQY